MRAVVLVGGEGTRLRPLTLTTPKQMLPVAEVPMIERVMGHLADHAVDEAVLSMGYRPDSFLAAFPDNTCAGVKLTYAVEPDPLDTAGGIAFAARATGVEETFLVVNGDVLTDLDLTALIAFHGARSAEATIALTPVDDPSAFGVVPTDARGQVTAFIEKPPAGEAPTNLINAGFYVLEPSVLDRVPVDGRMNIEREVFPGLVDAGVCFALASAGYWIDTGTPSLYLRANLDYVRGLRGEPPAPGAKQRAAGVWTLGAAVIYGALVAPTLVGDAAYIAGGAHVEESIVGAGARVEGDASVRGSVLLPGAVVHEGARVVDSIVGEGAVVGAGASLEGCTVVQGRASVEAGSVLAGERVTA
jgi:NDP-sugar pyrophosphorylase family protein